MKTMNLFMKFQFTSLSPDAQPISLGIVSGETLSVKKYPVGIVANAKLQAIIQAKKLGLNPYARECVFLLNPSDFCSWTFSELIITPEVDRDLRIGMIKPRMKKAIEIAQNTQVVENIPAKPPKTFYAEFSDFDINRCDDWVKESVVSKLLYKTTFWSSDKHSDNLRGVMTDIKDALSKWLKQFSDYQIQFITDCGTFDWYWMLQLIGEWDEKPWQYIIDAALIPPDMTIEDFATEWQKSKGIILCNSRDNILHEVSSVVRTGFPILPSNISPVPADLNDLIAIKKGISVREAFTEFRLRYCVELTNPRDAKVGDKVISFWGEYEAEEIKTITHKDHGVRGNPDEYCCINGMYWAYADTILLNNIHNSLFDAKVIKAIYEKLK